MLPDAGLGKITRLFAGVASIFIQLSFNTNAKYLFLSQGPQCPIFRMTKTSCRGSTRELCKGQTQRTSQWLSEKYLVGHMNGHLTNLELDCYN